MKFDLTISIVVFKKYEDAIETIKSIEDHTSLKIRKCLYIIDNSCFEDNESSRLEFEHEVRKYEDTVYINTHQNLGFGKGHNYTIDKLDSKYLAIVNPDILITDNTFENIISFMDETSAGMTIPKLIDQEGNLQDAYRRLPTVFDMFLRMFTKNVFKNRRDYHSMRDMDYSLPFEVPFGQGSFLVIRTDLWTTLNGFDDKFFMYLEDADLCRRVNEKSKLMFCPDAIAIHKWEKESHRNKALFKVHIQSMIKYFNTWGWKLI